MQRVYAPIKESADAAKDAAEAAKQHIAVVKEAEERQLRAYISPILFGVYCPDCGDAAVAPSDMPGPRDSVRFRIQNSGQTPAFEIRIDTSRFHIEGEKNILPNPPAYFDFRDSDQTLSAPTGTLDIGHDQIRPAASGIGGDQFSAFRDAIAGQYTLFVYGHIDYCDIFSRPHSEAFCFRYVPNAGLLHPACDRYNGEIPAKGQCNKASR